MDRKEFLKTGLAVGIAGTVGSYARGAPQQRQATAAEIEGPFYPLHAQKDKDFDLTTFDGKQQQAAGEHLFIEGVVLDEQSRPIEDAMVDLWQANAYGRYRHPHDRSQGKLDPNFQGWAIVQSGAAGGFKFKTVLPGTYLAAKNWERPPHIHFKVMKRGYVELITQMYFPDHPLNKRDFLLQRKKAYEQKGMVAELVKKTPRTYRYTIVLATAQPAGRLR